MSSVAMMAMMTEGCAAAMFAIGLSPPLTENVFFGNFTGRFCRRAAEIAIRVMTVEVCRAAIVAIRDVTRCQKHIITTVPQGGFAQAQRTQSHTESLAGK